MSGSPAQAETALVSKEALDTMVELNPQIEAKLVVVDESPYATQTMLLFRVDGLVPYDPKQLQSVEQLIEEYDRLRAR